MVAGARARASGVRSTAPGPGSTSARSASSRSELLKLALLLYSADLLARRADRMHELRATLYPRSSCSAGPASPACCCSPTSAGASCWRRSCSAWPSSPARRCCRSAQRPVGLSWSATVFITSVPLPAERWLAVPRPRRTPQDAGFQVWQSLVGIASGGLTGVGLGASKAKWGFLPEAHTDFIFAIIAEELGLVGVLARGAALFLAFGSPRRAASRSGPPDRFGMLLAGGITAWIAAPGRHQHRRRRRACMPLTGLTLPFVSFGGSSLLVTMAAAGLLLNVARTADEPGRPGVEPTGARRLRHRRRRHRRPRAPGLAVAEALVEARPPAADIHFVGAAARGWRPRLVPRAGFPSPSSTCRASSAGSIASNLRLRPPKLRRRHPARRCALLRRLRPRVVVSVGGYASVPRRPRRHGRLRIPVVVVSYDAVPGGPAAWRPPGRRPARWPSPLAAAPQVVTGAPLRPAILAVDRARDRDAARAALGLPADRFVLLVVGRLARLRRAQRGRRGRSWSAGRPRRPGRAPRRRGTPQRRRAAGPRVGRAPTASVYQVVRYEDRMHLAYAAADLVVARAGATTVAELAALGRAVDPRAVAAGRRGPPDRQRPRAGRRGGAVLAARARADADRLAASRPPAAPTLPRWPLPSGARALGAARCAPAASPAWPRRSPPWRDRCDR